MTSDEMFFMQVPLAFRVFIVFNILFLLIVFAGKFFKHNNSKFSFKDTILRLICFNIFIFTCTMLYMVLAPSKVVYREEKLKPKVITQTQYNTKQNFVDIPAMMLPINTADEKQCVVLDTNSKAMELFLDELYGDNIYFFNSRQNYTYLLKNDKFEQYFDTDFSEIDYSNISSTASIDLDKLGFDTVWLFSDLSNIKLQPTNCNVVIYVPTALTQEEIQGIKENGKITVVTIDKL